MSKELLESQRVVGVVRTKKDGQMVVDPGRVVIERFDQRWDSYTSIKVRGVLVGMPDPSFQLSLGGEFDEHLDKAVIENREDVKPE